MNIPDMKIPDVVKSFDDKILSRAPAGKNKLVIGAGCALFIYGLRETFNDVDAIVGEELYTILSLWSRNGVYGEWKLLNDYIVGNNYKTNLNMNTRIVTMFNGNYDIHGTHIHEHTWLGDEEFNSPLNIRLYGSTYVLHPSLLIKQKRMLLEMRNEEKDKEDLDKLIAKFGDIK